MNFKFNQHIGIFENVFEDAFCDEMINFFESKQDHLLRREDYWEKVESNNIGKAVDTSLMLDNFPNDPLAQKMVGHFFKGLTKCYEEYQRKCNIFDHGFKLDSLKLQKTDPSEGYHIFHCEAPNALLHDETSTPEEMNAALNMYLRFAAYTLYLNDVEEGGETEFLMQSVRIPSKKGSLCIFPSAYTHLHRGNPPLSSSKYIMTGWLLIPALPENQQPKNNK